MMHEPSTLPGATSLEIDGIVYFRIDRHQFGFQIWILGQFSKVLSLLLATTYIDLSKRRAHDEIGSLRMTRAS